MELTGARRSVLRGAWWIVLASGAWLFVVWPIDAYDIVFHCNPSHIEHAHAGNAATLVIALVALSGSFVALRRRDHTPPIAAAWLLLALPAAFAEWIELTMTISHRCGADVAASWIATPTRDAALVVTLAGPSLLVLGAVLLRLERRAATRLPPSRARAPRP